LADGLPDTNIVIFHVDKELGTAASFNESLNKSGVLAMAFGPQSIRFVTHLDVDREQILQACQIIRSLTS
jgi:threonine aldolase